MLSEADLDAELAAENGGGQRVVPAVGRCKLNPGLKAPSRFQKFVIVKGIVHIGAFNLNLVL